MPGREFMARDEIVAEISATHDLTITEVERVLDGLAGLGVQVDRLVPFAAGPEASMYRIAARRIREEVADLQTRGPWQTGYLAGYEDAAELLEDEADEIARPDQPG